LLCLVVSDTDMLTAPFPLTLSLEALTTH
jgi:hypothetical protein